MQRLSDIHYQNWQIYRHKIKELYWQILKTKNEKVSAVIVLLL